MGVLLLWRGAGWCPVIRWLASCRGELWLAHLPSLAPVQVQNGTGCVAEWCRKGGAAGGVISLSLPGGSPLAGSATVDSHYNKQRLLWPSISIPQCFLQAKQLAYFYARVNQCLSQHYGKRWLLKDSCIFWSQDLFPAGEPLYYAGKEDNWKMVGQEWQANVSARTDTFRVWCCFSWRRKALFLWCVQTGLAQVLLVPQVVCSVLPPGDVWVSVTAASEFSLAASQKKLVTSGRGLTCCNCHF